MDIYNSHNPTIKELEEYKEQYADSDAPQLKEAINLKIAALKTDATTLTKTMSAEQLFDSHNPLWAKPYSISELTFILAMAESISSKQLSDVLGQTTDYKALAQKLIKIHIET